MRSTVPVAAESVLAASDGQAVQDAGGVEEPLHRVGVVRGERVGGPLVHDRDTAPSGPAIRRIAASASTGWAMSWSASKQQTRS